MIESPPAGSLKRPGSGSRILTLRTATTPFADDLRTRALPPEEPVATDPVLLGKLGSIAEQRVRRAAAASIDRLEPA